MDLRLQRDFTQEKIKNLKNSLNNLLPQKLIAVMSGEVRNKAKQAGKWNNQRRKTKTCKLTKRIQNNHIRLQTSGWGNNNIRGINIKNKSKTMESKIIEGLYFAGEIIDVDAYTGGFNLQIAYSTGYTAGNNV